MMSAVRCAALLAAFATASFGGDALADDAPPPPKRDAAETSLLYITSMGWGAEMGVFFDGLGQASNVYAKASLVELIAVPATAGIGAVLPTIVDIAYHRRRGVPQTITSGMLLGLGEGLALNEYFANRSESSFHTFTKDAAWTFGGTSAGLVVGLVTASFVHATPGEAAWVATTGLFGGLFAGSIAGAASRPAGYPNPSFDRAGLRDVGITAAIGGFAGIAGGIATAKWLGPSELRVHLVDLGWIAGMALPGLACLDKCDAPMTFALMAIGGGIGFGSVFALTSLLPKHHEPSSAPPILPYASPLPGGGLQIGFGGRM
ncbi:MAG TPA: hypothetical protein VGH28_31500 [Polyangiaceae bacterium]|jgi:hypothetical protein